MQLQSFRFFSLNLTRLSLRYLWSVGSGLSPSLMICVWQTKLTQHCWMLLNSKKSLKCSPSNASRRWRNVTSWLQVPDTTMRASISAKSAVHYEMSYIFFIFDFHCQEGIQIFCFFCVLKYMEHTKKRNWKAHKTLCAFTSISYKIFEKWFAVNCIRQHSFSSVTFMS